MVVTCNIDPSFDLLALMKRPSVRLCLFLSRRNSVADPDPGSGAFVTLGSGIGFFRIPDLGCPVCESQTHIFRKAGDNFLGKQYYNCQ